MREDSWLSSQMVNFIAFNHSSYSAAALAGREAYRLFSGVRYSEISMGSQMCIRDRRPTEASALHQVSLSGQPDCFQNEQPAPQRQAVSYTHLDVYKRQAHGSSKAKGIKNAIRQAKICVENDLCGTCLLYTSRCV